MNRIVKGHPEAHEKLTAKLFWKLASESGYVDAGNVREFADATTRTTVTRARSAQGARHVNDEQADLNHEAWTFVLDERFPEQERLIKLARNLDDQHQNSTEGATATLENVQQGRSFDIGARNIANVSVSGSVGGLLEEGIDYQVDLENGWLTVVTDGGIANGEDLSVTFDQPGIDFEKRETQYNPLFYCDIAIEEFNQYSRMWLRRSVCRAYLNVTEFPVQSGEFASYRVKATPAGPVTVLKRPEALTLPTHVEEGAAAASSSSSRSSFSSSSSSSSSSSKSSSSSSSEAQLSSRSAGDFTSYSSQSSSSPSSQSSSSSVNSSSSSSSGAESASSASSPSSLSSQSYSSSSSSSWFRVEPGNSSDSLL